MRKNELVAVFFYGTFMSSKVLRNFGIDCERTIPAKIEGYQLTIRPRVNLVHKTSSEVFGGIAYISHEDISILYDGLKDDYGIHYHPYPVTAYLDDGQSTVALCYISHDIIASEAASDYIDEMCQCATMLKAPEWYINHIQSFKKD